MPLLAFRGWHRYRARRGASVRHGQAAPAAVTREARESLARRSPRTSDSVTRTYRLRLPSHRLRHISLRIRPYADCDWYQVWTTRQCSPLQLTQVLQGLVWLGQVAVPESYAQNGGPLHADVTAFLLARGANPLRQCNRITVVAEAGTCGHWLAAVTCGRGPGGSQPADPGKDPDDRSRRRHRDNLRCSRHDEPMTVDWAHINLGPLNAHQRGVPLGARSRLLEHPPDGPGRGELEQACRPSSRRR